MPPSCLASCTGCGAQLDTRAPNVYQAARGWTRNSNKGNSLTLAEHLAEWCCQECIDKRQRGLAPGQRSIFDALMEGRP